MSNHSYDYDSLSEYTRCLSAEPEVTSKKINQHIRINEKVSFVSPSKLPQVRMQNHYLKVTIFG